MILAKVTGTVVATVKNKHLENGKLLLLQPVDLNMQAKGDELVGLDRVQAGEGDLVLAIKEGGGTRITLNNPQIPLQVLVIAVVDELDIDQSLLSIPHSKGK